MHVAAAVAQLVQEERKRLEQIYPKACSTPKPPNTRIWTSTLVRTDTVHFPLTRSFPLPDSKPNLKTRDYLTP